MIRFAMACLLISNRRERHIVFAADRALALAAMVAGLFRRRRRPTSPRRILLLRLERIGDLVMTLPAIADARAVAPDAEIDLVVGSWNAPIANAIDQVNRVETLDAAWLAREHAGLGLSAMLRRTRHWRTRKYDLAINFEPDIRSNLLLALSGAAWTAGYRSGGGGPLLDQALDFDPRAHTSDNARRLVSEGLGSGAGDRGPEAGGRLSGSRGLGLAAGRWLSLPSSAAKAIEERLASAGPLVAVHASGGRAIKQWDPSRFAEVARRLATEFGATIVLTGASSDRVLVDAVKQVLPSRQTIDLAGELDLTQLAAVLQRADLLISGDTGPMHLASAVGTPVVAIFGPSDPARYAARGPDDRVVRVDLPCSPCNRIRHPPERCAGHTPDCLMSVSVEHVVQAAASVLAGIERRARVRV